MWKAQQGGIVLDSVLCSDALTLCSEEERGKERSQRPLVWHIGWMGRQPMRIAERHAWKYFLALGILFVAFGVSDVAIAVTFVSRQLAMALVVIAVLQLAISATALRSGDRWAWLVMWVWPLYLLADAVNLANEPTRGPEFAAFNASLAAITALTLALSWRRYLRRD